MEVGAALSFQSSSLVGGEAASRRPGGFARLGFREVRKSGEFVSLGCMVERRSLRLSMRDRQRSGVSIEPRVSCSCDNRGAAGARSENFHAYVDEALLLKRKAEDAAPYLNGRCLYLVGMMGSGKTTVGKILSEVLGYSFFDSDKLVEQAVGISSVSQIFKEHSEAFFRDNETNVLRDLSSMRRLVVATGGGAVIRPINWRYMRQGLTIWLDVPLDALARRITAVGTASRPLLHAESGDPYTKAFVRLTTLFEERGKAYANADARVCLEHIAAKQGHGDASALTPTAIAIEALTQIESFLTEESTVKRSSYLRG